MRVHPSFTSKWLEQSCSELHGFRIQSCVTGALTQSPLSAASRSEQAKTIFGPEAKVQREPNCFIRPSVYLVQTREALEMLAAWSGSPGFVAGRELSQTCEASINRGATAAAAFLSALRAALDMTTSMRSIDTGTPDF